MGSTLDTPLWVVIPAAGTGLRMGGDVPKQYRLLDGVCMIEHTVRGMLATPGLAGLVAVLNKEDRHWSGLRFDDDAPLHTVPGGASRAQSVLAGVELVLQQAKPDTWVMVHDAARPLVAASDLQRLIDAVYNTGAIGGLLATPVHDTLKKADDYAGVIATIERRSLWQAQTPQLFRAGELSDALHAALNTHSESITDEASAMELAGHQPLLVEALLPNFKITRPVDWELASALLQHRRLVSQQTPL